MSSTTPPRPQYRNIHVTQILRYRLPVAGVVSILHRISGALLFLLMPFILWMFDKSLTSDITYTQFTAAFVGGLWVFPAWMVKLATLALIWGYLHHFIAGVRHLYMDFTHSVSKEFGRTSATLTLAVSLLLTAALAYKLFI